MAQTAKPHFLKGVLAASERFQSVIKGNKIGETVVRAVAGSNSPAYQQLIWRSAKYQGGVATSKTAVVDGDKNAGLVPRLWRTAAVLATPTNELDKMKARTNFSPHPDAQEAVAYISEGALHVGTKATEGLLFEQLNEEESAIAMRLGRGPLEAVMGLYLPDTRVFMGVEETRIVEERVFVSALTNDYPGIVLA